MPRNSTNSRPLWNLPITPYLLNVPLVFQAHLSSQPRVLIALMTLPNFLKTPKGRLILHQHLTQILTTEDYLESRDKLHIVCNVGSLSKSQEGYSNIEKEAFAVVCSLEFFKPLLQGATQVYVLSDSRPFLFIMKMMKCGISRIQRWSLKLFSMPYSIIMVHIKGTVNYSDSLTRVWAVEGSKEDKPDMKKAIMIESNRTISYI